MFEQQKVHIEKVDEITVSPLSNKPQEFVRLLPLHEETKHRSIQRRIKPISLDEDKPEGHTRFVCISDTHARHRDLIYNVPDGDVLLHCGDFTNLGKLEEVIDFNDWLATLPHKHKIVIAGNHDLSFDPRLMEDIRKTKREGGYRRFQFLDQISEKYTDDWQSVLSNCTYIQDTELKVNGIRIYGTAWNPWFGGWAFNMKRGQPLLDKWNKIPGDGIDILMTHSPPAGQLDVVQPRSERVGCVELMNTVQLRVQPKYHVFGHIHESYGISTDGCHTFINCTTVNKELAPSNKAVYIDFPTPEGAVEGITDIIQH
uniref:Calcineurin-like phosphoesterase domain-containing protein n=1 Tax=Ciona savignyi TaxID=51511 RepID=H2YAX2_CIOSA